MNKKLYKLILFSYLGTFLVTFFIAMFFLIMQFMWKYIEDLVGKGLETSIITELMIYASANLVPMALPIAILLASIMTFGNLAETNEMTAMKSVGLSNLRIMRPIIVFIFFISIGSFLFANYTWPVANLKFRALISDIMNQKPALNFKEKVFNTDIDNFAIRIGKKDKNRADYFEEIEIADHTPKPNSYLPLYKKDIYADNGNIKKTADGKYIVMTLSSGVIEEELIRGLDSLDRFASQTTRFGEAKIRIDLSSLKMHRTDTDLLKGMYEMYNLSQLENAIDSVLQQTQVACQYEANKVKRTFMIFREPIKTSVNMDSAIAKANELKIMNANMESIRVNGNVFENGAQIIRSGLQEHDNIIANKINNDKIIDLMKVEWHRKLILPAACLILFFIGSALGLIIKKGGIGTPMVVATILFLVYYMISISGEKMAKEGVMEPYIGMWLSAFILAPIAWLLMRKSNADSKLFDKDSWLRLLGFKKRLLK